MTEKKVACPNGHENEAGSKFCERCGMAISAPRMGLPESDGPIPSKGTLDAREGSAPGISTRTVVLLAALVGIGAAAATGGLVYFLAGGGDDDAAIAAEPTVAATSTLVPTELPSPTPVPAEPSPTSAPGATRETALALGVARRGFNGWDLQVLRTDFDAVTEVMNENQFNEPPADGNTYILVRIKSTNVEAGPASELDTISFSVIDGDGNEYVHFVDTCGVYPDSFAFIDTVADEGESVEGNLCYQVPLASVGELVFYDDATNTWFALR